MLDEIKKLKDLQQRSVRDHESTVQQRDGEFESRLKSLQSAHITLQQALQHAER